jgi:hypothetical protein
LAQKIVTKLLKVWVWDPGKTYSGSRSQKGTGSRIRIRNTGSRNAKIVPKKYFFYFIEDPAADPEGFSYKPESSLIDVNEALMDIFDANFCRKQSWSGSISVLDPDSAKPASDYCTLITFR